MASVHIFSEKDFSRALAEHTVQMAAQAISRRGRFLWVLTGGNTPRPVYSLLATPEFAARIDWTCTHVFWSDERCVLPQHSASNFLMAKQAFLDAVGMSSQNIHRMHGELDPDEGAAAYETMLRAFFMTGTEVQSLQLPSFDLIHLGLGADGHVASLFPGDSLVHETSRWVAATAEAKNGERRLSFTFPVLNAARCVAMAVTGENKAHMLAQVLRPESGSARVPAQRVAPTQGELVWFLDAAAAKDLPH